jgi:hypothetical protein
LRLKWGSHGGPHPPLYSVGLESVTRIGLDIRDRLRSVIAAANGKKETQLSAQLRLLAQEGQKLYWTLFEPLPHDGIQPDLSRLKQWIEDERAGGDDVLIINSEPDMDVPWGLVFEGDPSKIPANAHSLADFRDFWALRHKLAAVFSGCSLSTTRSMRKRESFRLLSIMNEREFQHATEELGHDMASFRHMISQPVGPAFNLQVAEEKVEEAARLDTLLHFFGHCHDGRLDLGNNDVIDIIKFKMMMKRLTDRNDARGHAGCSFVFLNACGSAIGKADYSFRSAAALPGSCGLVATEAEVPRDFALKFGERFLHLVVEKGISIGDAMLQLRRNEDFWPLSLLYGCYAHPGYSVEPAAA